jgi:hypothetical protein
METGIKQGDSVIVALFLYINWETNEYMVMSLALSAFSPSASVSTTIAFSAVEDSSWVFTLNGVETIGGSATVLGAFIIAKEKEPGIRGKVPAVAIQFRILGVAGTPSYAGFLYQ